MRVLMLKRMRIRMLMRGRVSSGRVSAWARECAGASANGNANAKANANAHGRVNARVLMLIIILQLTYLLSAQEQIIILQ